MAEREVIVFENVTIEYPTGRRPIENTSFNIMRNTLALILGNSGSGKTSILRLVSGVIPRVVIARVSGYVRVLGLDPLREDDARKLPILIGFSPQSTSYSFTQYRVIDELRSRQEFLEENNIKIKMGIDDLVYMLRLGTVLKHPISSLSGGYKRRVLIARALIGPPPLIVLDEPTTDLDNESLITLRVLLGSLKKYSTLLVAEHRANLLLEYTDKVLLLKNGSVAEYDPYSLLTDGIIGEKICG